MLIVYMVEGLLIYIIYGEIDRKKMTSFVDANKIYFDDSTVDWCATYKLNKIYV